MARTLPVLLALAACHRDGDDTSVRHESAPFAVEQEPDGTFEVVLTPEAQAAAGIVTALSTAREVADEFVAFGVLAADPALTATIRAPIAGALVDAPGVSAWPAIGARVEAGAVIGGLLPRAAPLTPVERADVQARLAAARADVQGAQAQLDAAKHALERARALNAQDKGVSDQSVESAAAEVQADEGRLAAAQASIAIFERLVTATGAVALEPLLLTAPQAGECVAVIAQPGENVEAGSELLHIADFHELFADVRLPVGAPVAPLPSSARIAAAGRADALPAAIVGLAPEGELLAPRLRLRVVSARDDLRPGLAATAWLSREGPPLRAFGVPATAVLRYASRSWVYVEAGVGHFKRTAVSILRAEGDSVLVTSGVDAESKVVTSGAMTLLSAEQLAAGRGEGGG